ncbi:hypothetical protein J6E39_03290 [bacterium]|nr:hypothetical protein [bacterium]
MQVQQVSNQQYKPNFGTVYLSSKTFSKQQTKVANIMIEEFKKILPSKKISLQDCFQKKGYDFVIEPYRDNDKLVSLNAYKGFRLEGTGINQYATYNKGESFHVGNYNDEFVSNLTKDLKKTLF